MYLPTWGLTMPTRSSHGQNRGFISIHLLRTGTRTAKIAALPGMKQPGRSSHLMNGSFHRFTADKLLDFLKRFDRPVTIRIRPREPGEPYQEVTSSLSPENPESACGVS